MSQEFDTVDDIRTWLNEKEPSREETEEALEIESEGQNRTTGKMALNSHLDALDEQEADEVEDNDDLQEYVVMRPYAGNKRGDHIKLDPDSEETKTYVRDGRIERR